MISGRKNSIVLKRVATVTSTNEYLKNHFKTLPHGFALMADSQSAGRGRAGRSWMSEPGKDLTASFLYLLPRNISQYTANMTQMLALSVHRVLAGYGVDTEIKWPNDVLCTGKKICGILIEGVFSQNQQYLICGLGINVGGSPRVLERCTTTSLVAEGVDGVSREALLRAIMGDFTQEVELLAQGKDLSSVMKQLNRCLAYVGTYQWISRGEDVQERGLIEGLSPHGELLYRTSTGTQRTLCAGEILFS
ncbi:biotin--[acetyl-CoA-carboxylase] ligase [Chitinivibrio alkaliphilus]|uniref:Biotin--[acetyl-CoA-carboxylase] ligase n=1 Tax=Chitinivibrio alkaliphilus ACht1 TaxID=1313304 RepID=U7D9R0_9BACT|nr:biotin--[acetyl-CoA-carboxylase] ligase [Chitinivibrio alkaliphilus]ERP38762.1 biotin--[acetyl-CoA-carboxylase] ligase [Chitinivibrio alkaliphilus ACht1]